jgi:hypothetical protein
LAGGLLPFSSGASSMLLKGIAKATKKKGARASQPLDDEKHRRAAPLFTIAWLFDALPRAVGAVQPTLQNSDGEEVVFHEVRFPLAAGVTPGDIGARLDAISGLQRESDGFWTWLQGEAQKRPASKTTKAVSWNVTMESGATVLGNVELKGGFLTLAVNSANRAARGKAILADALGKLVRSPLTEIQTVNQMRRSGKGDKRPVSELPVEDATAIVHATLDNHYRTTLDEPVGMLGNRSPRAASASKVGRAKVAVWLKYLENNSAAHVDPKDPMATYDFSWIWRELGIEDLRR